ncbi:hypothetical protein BpHYR1_054295 [Brachionus plicatilis]|uniref:Uncharacterized protein n=1 Tax=Brachionus plicatilis TaxID=10195 RepID=A0A3M7QV31_BRAPC|nr:hypothetical protein BpHYR1_054295 [Brachionus plicatilis]
MRSLRVVLLIFLISGLAIQINGQCFEVETKNGWACEDRGGKVGNCNRSGGRCNYHITKWCHVTMRGEKMVPCVKLRKNVSYFSLTFCKLAIMATDLDINEFLIFFSKFLIDAFDADLILGFLKKKFTHINENLQIRIIMIINLQEGEMIREEKH